MKSHDGALLLFLGAALALAACGGGGAGGGGGLGYGDYPLPDVPGNFPPGPPPDGGSGGTPSPDLVGGVLLTIDTAGERWHWWVTNSGTAQTLQEVWLGNRTLGWFGGLLRSGPGAGDHNAPWSWHVDPAQNLVGVPGLIGPEMARYPSQCEAQLSYWLSFNANFIPMDATIVEFVDRRLSSEPPMPR